MRELVDMGHWSDRGVLVVERKGRASPGEWWAYMWLMDVVELATGEDVDDNRPAMRAPVRLELLTVVELLQDAGYGDRGAA